MFYHLLLPLASEFGAFNVFRYVTFRTAAATLTALFLAFLVGPTLIRVMAGVRAGQPIRKIGPDHADKAGTPTMGGLLILLSLLVSVLLWSNLRNRLVWIVIGVTVAYGLLDKSAMVHLDAATWTSAIPRPIFFFFMLYLASSVLFVPLALRRVPLRSLTAEG